MRRWPLSRKILGVGILNLTLLVSLALAYALVQYRVGAASLLLGPATDRVLSIGNVFRVDLERTRDPAALLRSYSEQHHAEFFLTTPGGHAIFGPNVVVPPPVIEKMRRDGPSHHPPPGLDDPPPKKGPPPGGGPREPVFFAISDRPTYYWAGFRLPVVAEDKTVQPGMLLMRTDSLLTSELFFEWRHWAGLAAAAIGITVLCWVPLLRGLTRAIAQMDEVTEQIAMGRFDARAPEHRQDELGHLGAQINRMAVRLENLVKSQKRFLGDTAHELSAPIARIQVALAILQSRVDPMRQADVAVLHEEIQEMSALVNQLLSFSKAGLTANSAPLDRVNVAEVVGKAAARETVAAEIAMDPEIAVMANEGNLQRAIGNLLRNARRYAGEDGPITVSAQRSRDNVTITVADHGPGLPPQVLDQVFEPFFRLEDSRSRDMGGTGLGLSIVKACVEACKGTVICRNRNPRGLEVVITLAAAP